MSRESGPRVHCGQPLSEGVGAVLPAGAAHYLRHVMRLDPGAGVRVFNGQDGEWQGSIDSFSKQGCLVRVERQRRAPPAECAPPLWLLFAPLKRDCTDFMVEKAAELGVSRLVPVLTRRTGPQRLNLDRLRTIAIEAAEQCERLDVAEVAEPVSLSVALSDWPGWPLLVCAETGAARPLATVAAALPPGPRAVMVGPEGGFSREELDELRSRPFVMACGLGPRVLRAETAALAALAVVQAVRGDWSDGRGGDFRPPDQSKLLPPDLTDAL